MFVEQPLASPGIEVMEVLKALEAVGGCHNTDCFRALREGKGWPLQKMMQMRSQRIF